MKGEASCYQMALSSLAGTCVRARAESPSLACNPNGDFQPLQCRTEGSITTCECVQPSDGTPIPGTQVVISDLDDIPECTPLGT